MPQGPWSLDRRAERGAWESLSMPAQGGDEHTALSHFTSAVSKGCVHEDGVEEGASG